MGNFLTRNSTRKQRLNKHLNKLHRKKYLPLYNCNAEQTDKREAVIEMVHTIASEIGIADSRLKVQNVILVGSVSEDTQLRETAEYDFQLVLEAFSQLSCVNVSKACNDRDGYVHIEIKDSALRSKCYSMIEDDQLKSTKGRELGLKKPGLRQLFGKTLTKTLKEEKVIRKHTGSLYSFWDIRYRVFKHGPAFTIRLIWDTRTPNERGVYLPISVDLCPVIRFCGPLTEIIEENCVKCQTYFKYAEENNLVTLMPSNRKTSCKAGLCFKITFTTTEILLMMDMSDHHRKCYRLLKYLLNGCSRKSPTAFCSYQLKVLVLNHHYDQKCTEESDLDKCLHNIVDDMIDICRTHSKGELFCANPFIATQNIWSHGTSIRDKDLKKRLLKLKSRLKRISKLCSFCIHIDPVNRSNCVRTCVKKVRNSIWSIFLMVGLFVFMYLYIKKKNYNNISEPDSN